MSSEDMRAEVGRRVRQIRERRGKSRAAVAGLVGKCDDWLKKIESGKRGLPLEMGVKLARLLNVSNLSEIYGPEVSAPVTQTDWPVHPSVDAVGQALTEYTLPTDDEPPSVAWLRAAIDQAWRDWHALPKQRTYAATELPALIRAARTVVRGHDGTERRQARAALGDVMHLGQAYLAWQDSAHHWYWLTVERGHQASEDADDPIAYATGLLYSALALRVSAREEHALDLLRVASDALTPMLADGPDDVRGLWGVLQLARASTTARHRQDPSAWVHWEAAEQMVSRLPDGYSHSHGYSRGHVALHKTWLPQCLGDSSEALRHAEHVDLAEIPSRTWQASHLINVARALHQQRDNGALIPLIQAEHYSPEAVQYNLGAREVIITLAARGQSSIRAEAAKLAQRLEIPA